jgi:hypothetical protein
MIRKSFLTFLLATAVFVSNAQTADEILAKYFENTGGLSKWKAVKNMKIEAKAPLPQGEFPLVIYKAAPNKSKLVINVQGKEIIQAAYDGQTAWSLNPFAGGTEAVKLDAETAKELSDDEMEDEFIDYKKKGHVVTLEGKEDIEGVSCYKIKLEKNKNNDKDDSTEIHYFDSENFVPIMSKQYARSGPAKGTEIQVFLSDYQEVDGLTIPFLIDQRMNGQSAFKIVITKITVNDAMDASVFAYPGK